MKKPNLPGESGRIWDELEASGFFLKYMSGMGADIGYKGDHKDAEPILYSAVGIDLNTPEYDGIHIPFQDNSLDYVYSSHCLEHIQDDVSALADWHRAVKPGGYIVINVPHQHLYERKLFKPSKWNPGGHLHFYTPAKLLQTVELALKPNTYRIRLLEDGDRGYGYDIPLTQYPTGQYEITLVIQKITPPTWDLI